MKILVTDRISEKGLAVLTGAPGLEVSYQPELGQEQLFAEIRDAAALIVRSRTQVTADVVGAASRLRVIGRAGAGVDNIDLEEATRKGILIMNTPGGNSISAAEHAFALMIALARKLSEADASVKAGEWNKPEFVGQELRGKTLGIVGLGQIGGLLARRAQAFQMHVIACDPFVARTYASDLEVRLCDLPSVLARADFLSLHLPLTDETRGIINRETLSLMKSTAFVINAARGGLVDEDDLLDSVQEGRLGGAAFDVFENEPRLNERLLQSDRVILTPHIAGSTVEAQDQVGRTIATQVVDYLQKSLISNAVNFPSLSAGELEKIASFLKLASKLGTFASQICQIRISQIGIRYYGDLSEVDYRPISNHLLKAILRPMLAEPVNEVNARTYAAQRGIEVIETASTRSRDHANLISVRLRNPEGMEWVEGAILHQGSVWLVSVDGIPLETPLGDYVLFIRNQDTPGVIGAVGTILGENEINIASFVLGRESNLARALGIINTDNPVPEEVMGKIRRIAAISYAQLIEL